MKKAFLACVAAAGLALPGRTADPSPSPVLEALRAELARSQSLLKTQAVPPYFLSYEVTETDGASVSAAFGQLTWSGADRRRHLDVDLRVGDPSLDNTRPLRDERGDAGASSPGLSLPIEDDVDALRARLWMQTERQYLNALERLARVKTNARVKVEEEDKSPDFSSERPETWTEPIVRPALDRAAWEEKVRRYSAPFAAHGEIYQAQVQLSARVETRWYVNTEGAVLQTCQPYYYLSLQAVTKAEDGMDLPRYETFFADDAAGLPKDGEVLAVVEGMIRDLKALRAAPPAEPFTGPAVLSGRAGAVFFHEVFGHPIEGDRQRRAEQSQTFKKQLNKRIMPEFLSIHFDPTVRRAAGGSLSGVYRYDNQGVKARRVAVVEKGVFREFLMSRKPVEGFPRSNGHGRKQPGRAPMSRQSNLIVKASKTVPRAALKQELLRLVKAQKKPYGLLFEDIQGGFTTTWRSAPNAFSVLPVMVFRVYPDGREQLVRGVDLIGTPLAALSRITAADDQAGVFNGFCGAESGSIPVSGVSPGLLISQIEVQKKDKSEDRPPLLPPPGAGR